jgi:hypothetical protein
MRKSRKILLLPVLAAGSAAVVLLANLGVSASPVPPVATHETTKSTSDDPIIGGGTAVTVTNWNETAGLKKGNPGGANGTQPSPVK